MQSLAKLSRRGGGRILVQRFTLKRTHFPRADIKKFLWAYAAMSPERRYGAACGGLGLQKNFLFPY